MAGEWAWKNISSRTPDNVVFWPAGQYPTEAGWVRVEFTKEPGEFNTFEYGTTNTIDASIVPGNNINVDSDHVTDRIITTRQARATGLYALAHPKFTRSVNFIKSTAIGVINPMKYKFKWPVSMED
jgi:hypothetical protein